MLANRNPRVSPQGWRPARLAPAGALPPGAPISPAMIGQSCASWEAMASTDKLLAISNWGTRYGYTFSTSDVIQISGNLDTFCAKFRAPTLADVASNNCTAWNLLSDAEKTARVSQWMDSLMASQGFSATIPTPSGTTISLSLISSDDVNAAVAALNACTATVAATSVTVCLQGQASNIPPDISVTLDGRTMPATTTGCYSIGNVDASQPHRVIVTGTGIVTQSQDVTAIAGSDQMVDVPLRLQTKAPPPAPLPVSSGPDLTTVLIVAGIAVGALLLFSGPSRTSRVRNPRPRPRPRRRHRRRF